MAGRMLPHTSEIITFFYIDAELIDAPRCPNFEKFLNETFDGDETIINRVWQMIGYVIMHTNEAKCFFHMGEAPDSGKSLLGNFIQSLFPREHVSNLTLNDFHGRFSLVKLVGAAVNISLDLPSSELQPCAVSKLKMLTGGDTINVEEKYEPSFTFRNTAKLIFASNFPLRIKEDDDAFWNRLVYLPFTKSIPSEQQDKTLMAKFQREKNSIVTMALRHARTLVENGFVFSTNAEIEKRVMQFRNIPFPTVQNYIDDICEFDIKFQGEHLETLYGSYSNYCEKRGFTADAYNSFKAQFAKSTGLSPYKTRLGKPNPQAAFKGVKIKEFD